MKKRLHLVYAIPKISKKWSILNKIVRKLTGNELYYYSYKFLDWNSPIYAPYSITYNICKKLNKKFNIRLYSIFDNRNLILKTNDIFLGHPWPDFKDYQNGNNSWKSYDKNQITNKLIVRYPNDKRVYIICPFNHSIEQIGWIEPLLSNIFNFVALSGDIWINTLKNFPLFEKFNNVFNINMSIDQKHYPHIKKEFNKKGERKFLYIGRLSKEKNIKLLEYLASSIENFNGGFISDGDIIEGWHKISSFRDLKPDFMREIALEYDVFVNASDYDAQATTILEAMSWGFMILCTKETGYTHDSIFELKLNDNIFNSNMIFKIQTMDDLNFKTMQNTNFKLLKDKYSWDVFSDNLENILTIYN
jgi:glycosyltransferase involved in cell wall biosynthesis